MSEAKSTVILSAAKDLPTARAEILRSAQNDQRRRPLRQILFYVLPAVASGAVTAPVYAILPALYAKHAEVTMAALGTLLVALRVWDAVSDPLIGYWSDQTRHPRYNRKPWIVIAAIIMSVSAWFLFQIPPAAGIGYLALWSFLFYFGYTAHEVPHLAWGSELTADYAERAKVFSARSMALSTGGFFYTLLPIGLFYLGWANSTEYTPEIFRDLGYGVLILFPLTMLIAVRYAPAGEVAAPERGSLIAMLRDMRANPPLLRFLGAYVVCGAGTGVYASLFFPYFDSYLHIGDKVPHLMVVALISQFVSQPFWARMVGIFGKHRTWAYGWIANSFALVPMALIEPGPQAVWPVLVFTALYCFSDGVSSVAPYALLADVVDYEVLKRRVDRAGNYYAFMLFIAKLTGSIGGLVFVFLGVTFGYSIADGAQNSDLANFGMLASFCFLPSLFQFAAIPLIWNFPIDRRRQAIIRKRLAQREARRHA